MPTADEADRLLDHLDLKEYEATALKALLSTGRTTAPQLADATGIPKARIYGVLESLANKGFIKIIPGRPKEYQPKPPGEILDRAAENRRQAYESYRQDLETIREDFLDRFEPLYEQASDEITPTEELFYVVDVGEASETETRQLYQTADETLHILTKSFEYFAAVESAFQNAVERDLTVRVLFLEPSHLSAENEQVQRERIAHLTDAYPEVEYRFSQERLPWRGTLSDPSLEYDTGKAIFLVEEEDIPLHLRQAAVTENESFVAGLNRYFELVWEYESVVSPA